MAKKKLENVHELLYEYLLTLKIDAQQYQKFSNTPLSTDIFCLPNKGAFLYVTYFLFDKYDHSQCKKKFELLWPPLNKKNASDFLKVAYNWLSSLANENTDARIPKFTLSLFMISSGDKLCHAFLAFARFVLQKFLNCKRNVKYLEYPTLSLETKTASLATHLAMYENLLSENDQTEKSATQIHNIFSVCASSLTNKHCMLKSSIKNQEMLLTKLNNELCEKFGKESEIDAKIELENQNKILLASTRTLWQRLEENYRAILPSRSILLDDFVASDKRILDGNMYPVQIPGSLLNAIHTQLKEESILKVQEDGKLDFGNLMKFFKIALSSFDKQLTEVEAAINIDKILPQHQQLQKEAASSLQNMTKIETEILPTFDRIINDHEKCSSTLFNEPKPVFIEGKDYFLQQAAIELEPNIILNDSASSLLMNVSPANWLENPESDNTPSPDIFRRPADKVASIFKASASKTKVDCLLQKNIRPRKFNFEDKNINAEIVPKSAENTCNFSNQTLKDLQKGKPRSSFELHSGVQKHEINSTFSSSFGKATDLIEMLSQVTPSRKSFGYSKQAPAQIEDLFFGTPFNTSFSPSITSHDSLNFSLLDNQTLPECPEFDITSELDASNLLLELST